MGPTSTELRLDDISEQLQEVSRRSPQSEHTSLSKRSLRHEAHIPTLEDEGCFGHGVSDCEGKSCGTSTAFPPFFMIVCIFFILPLFG